MTRNDFEKKYENFNIKQALHVDNFFLIFISSYMYSEFNTDLHS